MVADADDAIEYVGAEGGSIHGDGCVRGRGGGEGGSVVEAVHDISSESWS